MEECNLEGFSDIKGTYSEDASLEARKRRYIINSSAYKGPKLIYYIMFMLGAYLLLFIGSIIIVYPLIILMMGYYLLMEL